MREQQYCRFHGQAHAPEIELPLIEDPESLQVAYMSIAQQVISKKLDALDALVSQFYEGGANGSIELVPSEPAKQQERQRQVRSGFERRSQDQAQRFKAKLAEFYGQDKAGSIRYASTFSWPRTRSASNTTGARKRNGF